MACSCSYCALFCSCIKKLCFSSLYLMQIHSHQVHLDSISPPLSLTIVRTGDTVFVSLAYSDGDPNNFYLSMYCTNNGKTDVSVSDVAILRPYTTEDISVVSLGWFP